MASKSAATILRWGLAFVLFFSAVESLRHPDVWAGYLPQFLTGAFPTHPVIAALAAFEIVLAAWLFWGKKLAWAAAITVAAFAVATIVNLPVLDDVFTDIGLAMAALALFELAREKNFKEDDAV